MSYVLAVGLNPALQKILSFNHFKPHGVNRASTCTHLASGKGINVARTLSILGYKAVTTGFLGGPNGLLIEAELKREGIHSAFTSIAAGTRQCITLQDIEHGTTTELIEPSPVVSPGEIDHWFHAYESLVPWCQYVTISGTAPTGVPSMLYKRLILYAHKIKKPILLDCGGELWREGQEVEPNVMKSNEDEFCEAIQARQLTTKDLAVEAKKRLTGKIDWIVITRGPEPALFVNRKGIFWAEPPRIDAINPIGSGDAVSAGMVAAIIDGLEEEFIIRNALACGTANALISGPGVVRPQDVKKLASQVKIKTQENK